MSTTEMESPLTTARGKVKQLTSGTQTMCETVAYIADAVFGEEGPSNQPVMPDKPPRNGEAGMLHDDIEELDRRLTLLLRQIQRLESLGLRSPQDAQGTVVKSRY